jgi:endoglucanase
MCDACGREAVPAPAAAAAPAQAPNRISNGDFSSGIAPWGAHVAGGASSEPPLRPRLENGALCTPVKGGQEIIVGWPVSGSADSFALVAGAKYELSLRAAVSGTLPVECVIKVGHQVAPYTAAFATPLPLGSTLERFGTEFTPDHDDDRAGLAVECRGAPGSSMADVCIDDVSVMLDPRRARIEPTRQGQPTRIREH